MKRIGLGAVATGLLMAMTAAAAADEKLDKAIADIEAKFAKIDSYAAKSETKMDMAYTPEYQQKSDMKGTVEWVRKDEKALMRAETQEESTITQSGNTTQRSAKYLIVSDGTYQWSLSDVKGEEQKTVMKVMAQPASSYHPEFVLNQIRAYQDLALLDDETVGGESCYAFEAKMKPQSGMPPTGRSVMYFAKSSGINVKVLVYDADDKVSSTTITTDLKINPSLSDDRFKFEVPEGATVNDMTNMQQSQGGEDQAAADGGAEQKKEEKPAEEQPKEKKKKLKLPKFP